MKIVIVGDLAPTENNVAYFRNGDIGKIVDKKIIDMFDSADCRILNLECVLGSESNYSPIDKFGPALIAPDECIKGLTKLGVDYVLLANNHILDYGVEGLDNTIKVLEDNRIRYAGVISKRSESPDDCIIKNDDLRVGIYNVCENEFSVATDEKKGANGLNEIKNCMDIAKLKKKCDKVIVIFHGGKEFYRYPSPKLKLTCHNFVDYGADYVIVQHSHCVGCEEDYKGKKIIYGQGNFIFDRKDDEFWNSEILLLLDVSKDGIRTDYTFVKKVGGRYFVDSSDEIHKGYIHRTEQIKDDAFLRKKYDQYSIEQLNLYLSIITNPTFLQRVLNKIFGNNYYLRRYSKEDCLAVRNIVECESHRELLLNGLEKVCRKGMK